MKTFDEFKEEILNAADKNNRPRDWRFGQTVFNYVNETYGVAREVQFVDGIDCFFDDNKVDDFILHAYVKYAEIEKRK